jgi:hypothetical protein
MKTSTFTRISLILAMLAIACSVSTLAQTVTGSIRGTVTDPSGAVVAGTKVKATNTGTGVATVATTDRAGTYNIESVPIGSYVVTATMPGFSVSSIGPFALEIDQIAKIDVKLQVGAVTTTVEVGIDTGAVLQTEDSTLGTTVTANTIESLPLSGQNISSATMFVAGAVDPTYSAMGGTNGTERDLSASSIPSFNGNRQQTNNYILDGTDINEPLNNVIGYNVAPEALQEVRTITGNASAEYGNVNGGEVIMVTKGGTNQFHGSLYSYYENQDLTADLWSNKDHAVPIPKGVFHQNQFGATLGGPIFRNKLFFFVDFEGYRNTAAGAGSATVPTVAMRKGDFSEFLGQGALGITNPANYLQLYNTSAGKSTTAPYASYVNNQIPIKNPIAQYLFAHPEVYPLPNQAPSNLALSPDAGNYTAPTKSIVVNNQGDVRIDYVLGTHDSINSRFSMGDAWDATPFAVLPITFPAGDEYPFYGGVLNEVHTFTAALQTEFRAGFSRVGWQQGQPNDPTGEFGLTGDSKLGLPFPNQPFPGFSLINLSSSESNIGTKAAATTYYDNIFDYGDNVTWLRGRHILKFGAQVLRYQENNYYPSTNGNLGQFVYNGAYTANSNATATGQPKTTGYGYADFVLDDSSSQGVSGVAGRVGQRMYRLAFYAQDDFKLTPNLTLNIGFRYGYDQPLYEVNNKEVNVDVDNPQNCPATCLQVAGQNGNSRALYNPFYAGVMPRVGFAYQAHSNIVFRGGYGITDDQEGTGANLRLSQNAPFIFQFSNTAATPTNISPGTPVPVENGFAQAPGNVQVSSTRYEAWSHRLRPSLIQQFNLTTEILLNSTTTAQLGYVGQLGQHLVIPENANQYTTPGVSTSGPFNSLVGAGGLVYLTQSEGYSNYHALQATIRHRQSNGLEYTLNYTWSKAMTNNPGFYGVSGVDGASVFPQNIYNPHGDYGVAGYNTPSAVNFTTVYQLPFGHGQKFGGNWNRLLDESVGGWKLSGDAILYAGFPITITATNAANANAGTARADQYSKLIVKNRSTNHWFGTDPSATPCTGQSNIVGGVLQPCAYGIEPTNSFGTAHVGTERAPGYRIIDMSIFKEFRTYKEEVILFRADAFNTFNLASYAAPGSSASSTASFGLITSTLSPARQFQFSAKYRF